MGMLIKKPFQLLFPNAHHMLAFASSVTNSGPTYVEGVADAVFASAEVLFIAPTDLQVVYAAGLNCADSTIKIIAPSLAAIYPQIQPLEDQAIPTDTMKIMNFVEYPINIQAEENFGARAINTGGTHDIQILMGVADTSEKTAMIPGEGLDLRWIRATATLANTKNVWGAASLSFDDSLPAGIYDVYGMIAREDSGDTSAIRLVFPDQIYRPGCLISSNSVESNPIFQGGLGLWGSFSSFAPPTIESLSSANGTPVAEIYLLVSVLITII